MAVPKITPPENRRVFSRTPCDLYADLEDDENSYSGHVRNLGQGGAFIQRTVHQEKEIGREVIMTIPFKARPNHLIIKARIAWVDAKGGMGVAF